MPNDSTQEQVEAARLLALNGFRIFPCRNRSKIPAIREWPEIATVDEAVIAGWRFGNIGIRTGATAVGVDFFVVDIDVKDDQPGLESWQEQISEIEGLSDAVYRTVCARTPTGGLHYYFTVPEGRECPRNGRPWKGIDIRGEGGFVVAPPSITTDGEYVWIKNPEEHEVAEAPIGLLDALDRAALKPSPPKLEVIEGGGMPLSSMERAYTQHPSNRGGDSPADWVRDNVPISSLLAEGGWTQDGQRGEDSYWVRPGKLPRDGHSAVLHGEGPLVVWTTELPDGWQRLGRDNRDGSRSYSPFEVYAAVHFGGSLADAGSTVRRQFMDAPLPGGTSREGAAQSDGGDPGPGVVDVDEGEGPSPALGLNLPEEFWEASDTLTHIRDAALSRLVSPDATLVSVLARVAAMTAPTVKIPAFVGSQATFDFMTVVVAASSGGKSVSNDVSADLLPGRNKQVMLDAPIGSGEGIIQAFMGFDEERKEMSYKHGQHHSIHFTIDEGLALVRQGARQGTTVLPTLLSAWSGKTLGQLNASVETKRLVPGGKRRVAATINMQTANGWMLWEHASSGLVSRCLFGWAHAPVPDELPEWPGPLDIKLGHGWGSIIETEVGYPPEVAQAVREARVAVMTGSRVLGDDEGHDGLVRVKTAGLLAFLHSRRDVTTLDWDLAGLLLHSSNAIKRHLQSTKRQHDQQQAVTRATAAGHARLVEDEVVDRGKIERVKAAVIRKLGRSQGHLTVKDIRDSLDRPVRLQLPAAIEELLEEKRIVCEDDKGYRLP